MVGGNSEQLQEQFARQGYVILRNFLEPQVIQEAAKEMETLVERHAQNLLSRNKVNDTFREEPFETRFYRLYESCIEEAPTYFRSELHLPGLFNLFFHPRLLDMAEILIGGEIRLYPNYTARPKLPEWEGTQVLWHQDGGYTEGNVGSAGGSVDTLRMVNVWTPLVPVNVENGCMQFIPGTHKLGSVPHVKRKYYLEIAHEHLEPLLDKAVNIELKPGDIVLFHNLLFHQGLPNRSSSIRWSFDWRYQDAGQPTLRMQNGHIARSRTNPNSSVLNAEKWAKLTFS